MKHRVTFHCGLRISDCGLKRLPRRHNPQSAIRNPQSLAWPLLGALILAAAGCMVGPDYKEPAARVEQEWLEATTPQLKRGQEQITHWWKVFNDPMLDALVERAYKENPSLQAAGVRVLQAQAARGVAIGLLFPQTQEASGSFTWNQASENSGSPRPQSSRFLNRVGFITNPLGSLLQRAAGDPGLDPSFHNWEIVGLSVGWELDVWGRFRRGIEGADAGVLATLANYDDVLVSLIGEVATNYVLLRTLEEQLEITRQNLVIQQRGFEIAQTRFKGGTVSELDSVQAQSLMLDTESQIPALEASIRQTRIALCVLMGMPPQDITQLVGEKRAIPVPPETVSLGVPAELLRRRPDIRRAERLLAVQSANIGIAVSDLLPRFSLVGDVGLSSEHFSDLFRGSSFQAFVGPSFRWAILNYGRIINNVRVEDAAYQALISEYENLVLRAQGEVETAMAGLVGAQRQITSLAGSVQAATRAVQLAETQYRGGIADYTRVLNTQEFLITEQSRLISTRGSAAQSLVTLYRALGGGWELRGSQQLVPEDIKDQMRERTWWGSGLDADRFEITPATQAAE